MDKEGILKEIRLLEDKLAIIDPSSMIYIVSKPTYFNKHDIGRIIDSIYDSLRLPKDLSNSTNNYVIPRMIVTYFLHKNKNISTMAIIRCMGLNESIGRYYLLKAAKLIKTNKNAANLYANIVRFYG